MATAVGVVEVWASSRMLVKPRRGPVVDLPGERSPLGVRALSRVPTRPARSRNRTRPVGTTVALIVTVLRGLGIGVLAVLDVPIIAAVGAVASAAMWVVTALLRGGRATKT